MPLSSVAITLPNLGGGGAERVALGLAQFLATRGHSVQLVVAQRTGSLLQAIPTEVHLVDLAADNLKLRNIGLAISTSIKLFQWLRCNTPDAVISSITGMNLVAILACRAASFEGQLIVTEHTTLQNFRNPLRKVAMRLLYPRADLVVAVSSSIEAQLIGELGIPQKKVCQIPNGIDKSFLREQAKMPVEHPWFLNPSSQVAVAVGRLSRAKDYPTLIHAFDHVRKELDAKLLIIGEGPERKHLETLIRSLELEGSIELIGFDANPWRWVSRARLYVMSSAWEGCPLALLEALALGTNCVVTAYDDSILENRERYGLSVVPRGDAMALGRTITQQLSFPVAQKGIPDILDCTDAFSRYNDLINAGGRLPDN